MERRSVLQRLQAVIVSGLETTMDGVMAGPVTVRPVLSAEQREQAVAECIATASRRVASISFSGALLPGWAGIGSLAPNLVSITREQMCLVRDVACLYGNGEPPSPTFVMGVLASSLKKSASVPSLPMLHAQAGVYSSVALQSLSLQVAGCVASQALAAAASRWLPAVGPAALGVWSGYTTRRIGQGVRQVFQSALPTVVAVPQASPDNSPPPAVVASLLDMCKLQVLIGLAHVDGRVSPQERVYIDNALADPRLSVTQRARLQAMLAGQACPLDGVETLARYPGEAIGLLANMAVLAWRDGQLHPAERLYIRRIGNLLGYGQHEVDELLEHAGQPLEQAMA